MNIYTNNINNKQINDINAQNITVSTVIPYTVEKPEDKEANPINTIDKDNVAEVQAKKRAGLIECETCKSRQYQDSSTDLGVSFKTSGHIEPTVAGSVVMAHELEHVSNENAEAKSENKQVISQAVTLQTSICPECGRVYISGGQTITTTRSDNKKLTQDQLEAKGNIFDIKV